MTHRTHITEMSQATLPCLSNAEADSSDWAATATQLNTHGSAILRQLLTPAQCAAVAGLYPDARLFRSRVVMQRHGFGQGEYQYFSYPLPAIVAELRARLYPQLVGVANAWNEAMGMDTRYPPSHADFLAR